MSKIGWGDRAPDFWLPNPEGKLGRFYDRFQGNLVVMFFFPSSQDAAARKQLLGFVEQRGAFEELDTKIVAVSKDASADNATLVATHAIDFTLFSDPAGAITRGYGADESAQGIAAYVLDRNQRVLKVFHGTEGDDLAQRAALFLKNDMGVPAVSGIVSVQAPVLLIPNVFDADCCAALIRAWEADHAEGAVRLRAKPKNDPKTRVVDYALKKRLDHKPDQDTNQTLIQLVLQRIAPEVYKAFQFQVAAIELFCVGAYDADRGDYFRPHRDNTTPQTANRRFAVTINLNDDYDGGGVVFPEYSSQCYRAATGGAVVFSCSLLHEATAVTSGRRFVALTFLAGNEAVQPQSGT